MLLLMAGIESNPGPPKKDLQVKSEEDQAISPLEAHFARFRLKKRMENTQPRCKVTTNSKEVSTHKVEDYPQESGSSCIEMEPQTQASPLDQLKTQVPVPTEPARKAPPVRLRVSRSFNAQGDKKQEERQNVLKARNAPSVPQKPQRVCRENDAQPDKKEMEQQNFKEVFGTTTTAALTETAQTTPGVAGIEQATYQRSEDSPRQQSEQSAVFFISPNVTVEKGFPTEVSDGPAMGDMADTAAVTADIPETEGVASQRRTDTLNHQVGQTALVVIPPDVTVYKGSPTKNSDGQAMGIMTESTVITAESPADIAGTEDVVSQRSADTPKHQKEQTALIVIPSDDTVYKGSPTNDSDGPAMGIIAESTFLTADIAGTEDVVSQRSADTPKHLKEQTALIVIPPDVTAYKETPTKDSDGQAMSDMTESTDVTGGIAETKEVASQRKIDTPKHQSEHTALDVIPPDVTKYKGTPTKEHSGDIQKSLLRRLGLEERFEHNLITVQEAMTVHTNQPRGEKWSLSQLPWTMLRNIIAVDSTARDCFYSQETENTAETLKSEGQSVFDVRSRFGKGKRSTTSKPDVISQMDIFMTMYLCCEPMLKQLLFRKMFLCKQALPFIYRDKHSDRYSVSIWPLKPITFYTETNEFKGKYALDMNTRVISFARIGRPNFSKSQLLNCILSGESNAYSTFYSHDCTGGMIRRKIVGFVEIFWLQKFANRVLPNDIPLTLLNIRGDIRTDITESCFDFVENLSSCFIIFLETKQIKELLTLLKGKKITCKLVLYFTDSLSENGTDDTFDYIEELHRAFKLQRQAIQEYNRDKNFFNNTNDLLQSILDIIRDSNVNCLNTRFKPGSSDCIKFDIDDKLCREGLSLALDILKVMKTELQQKVADTDGLSPGKGLFKYCKQYLTPVSSSITKRLSQNLKERKRTRDIEEKSKLDEQVLRLRSDSVEITRTVQSFIQTLCKTNSNATLRKYFLANLRELFECESRSYLPIMKQEKSEIRSQYIYLKAKYPDKHLEIEHLHKRLSNIELDIENASFGVEHLFREIGHICDSSHHCGVDLHRYCLPPTEDIANIVADLVFDGEILEIIDGDNAFLASKWIAMVFKSIEKKSRNGRVMTLSVLGLQSSGKSTLLNSMFGSHFSVSSGRCTRGVSAQLLSVNRKRTTKVDYILIIDSEGLRAPELDSVTNVGNRDNELATFVTGLGDLTLMNIMGENMSDMRDILQIIVHAYLRLKLANGALNMRQTCMFVHHNVSDRSAADNMKDGFIKLMKILDTVTSEAAETEGSNSIKRFTDIIEFNEDEQVHYIPNLWQGTPPMNRVNKDYCMEVAKMKFGAIHSALELKPCFSDLMGVVTRAEDLWEGILSENFVFSFRNNMEIKAYRSLDKYVRNKVWDVQTKLNGGTLKSLRDRITSATTKQKLVEIKNECVSLCQNILSKITRDLEKELNEFFDTSEERELIQKWRFDKIHWAKVQCNNFVEDINADIQKKYESRLLAVELSVNIEKTKEEFRTKALEFASSFRGKSFTETEKNKSFEDIWLPYEKNFRSNKEKEITPTNFSSDTLFNMLIEALFELHKHEHHHLGILEESRHHSLKPPTFTNLKQSYEDIGIDKHDASVKTLKKKFVFKFKDQKLKNMLGTFSSELLAIMDFKIDEIMSEPNLITNTGVSKLIRALEHIATTKITKHKHLLFSPSYKIKFNIHVCRYAAYLFGEHNEQYENTHGINVTLTETRKEMQVVFHAALENCREEEKAANLFCLSVKRSLKNTISENIPLQSEIIFRKCLPQMKYILLKDICKDLALEDIFDNFIMYLKGPREYAKLWIQRKCNKILFKDGTYMRVVTQEARNCLDLVRSAFISLSRTMIFSSEDTVDGRKWFEQLNAEINGLVLDSSCFGEFEQQIIQDVPYFCNVVRKGLDDLYFESDFEDVNEKNIQWSGYNPISRLSKRLWGCEEQCPFCSEPCSQNEHNSKVVKHVCNQHQPAACVGTRDTSTLKAVSVVCNYAVDSNLTHTCEFFDYRCNDRKEECPEKIHNFKDYANYCADWDIRPKDSMHDGSLFWQWFLGKYKNELKEHHHYDVSDFPSWWSEISVERAIKSLDECYN